MTDRVVRLYVAAIAVVVFFVAWAAIAARPWAAPAADPRLAALQAREQRLQRLSVAVKAQVDRRWAAYRAALAARQARARNLAAAAAAAPSVRVVTLPPLTVTRTS
jgi:hypothetical protein